MRNVGLFANPQTRLPMKAETDMTDSSSRPTMQQLLIEAMTIDEVCDTIGLPPEDLAGNCHYVSTAIVAAGLAGPRARVARGGYAGYMGQHSWIVVPDFGPDDEELVIDATVNGVDVGRGGTSEPRLFVGLGPGDPDITRCEACEGIPDEHPTNFDGLDCPEWIAPYWPYDEAMDDLRSATDVVAGWPDLEDCDPIVDLDLPGDVLAFLALAGMPGPYSHGRLCRLASSAISRIGTDRMRQVIVAIDKAGCGWAVPIDHRPAVGLHQ